MHAPFFASGILIQTGEENAKIANLTFLAERVSTSANPPFPPPPPFKGRYVYLPPPAHSSLFLPLSFSFSSAQFSQTAAGKWGGGGNRRAQKPGRILGFRRPKFSLLFYCGPCMPTRQHTSLLPPPLAQSLECREREKISLSSPPPPLFFLFF